MSDFFSKLFSGTGFMPHGHCYLWNKDILWLNILSDAVIAIAYYCIPILLIYFVKKRKDIRFNWLFIMFSLFIIACGTTHVLEIIDIWTPVYRLTGLIKAITAFISIITGVMLVYIIPQALAVPGPGVLEKANAELAKEIVERKMLEEKFSGLLEAAPDGMIITNEKNEIVLVNQQTEKLFNYNRLDLIGKQVSTLLDLGNINESTGIRNDKSVFPISVSSSSVTIPDETLIFVSVRDISEQKKTNEKVVHNEKLLAEAQQIAHIGSWEWDIANNKIIWTDELYMIYGLEPQSIDMNYAHYLELIHPEDKQMVDEAVRGSYKTHDSFSFYHKILRPGGKVRTMFSSGKVLCDNEGNAIKMTGIGQDVTESKIAEEMLNAQKENLERKNLELIQYTYIISHDLKAPLRAIGNLAQWLEADYKDKLDDQGKESLSLINARVSRMYQLIDGILRHSKIGNTDFTQESIKAEELILETIDLLAPPANIQIHIDCELPVIKADRVMIGQVFQNLISNAIKYMDKPEGTINIGYKLQNDHQVFYIKDNGPGIDKKYHEKVFQIFQTLQARDNVESTGVGLALVKKIVEMNNGRIWIESVLGEGSTFYFYCTKS